MKLHLITDRANHHALKIVISAGLNGMKDFSVSLCSNTVPVIEGLRKPLFNCNEAAKLMFPQDGTLEELALLEWEESALTNAVRGLYHKRFLSEKSIHTLAELQEKLPEIQKSGLASVVFWCSLLPALCNDGVLPEEKRKNIEDLYKWWNMFFQEKNIVIVKAFASLGVQEITDFLRCRHIYRMTPLLEKTFYITTPIYYVNASPHVGHVYSTMIADAISRYHYLKGENTFLITGTDEHGQKIAESAAAKGIHPQKFCDEVSDEFKKCFEDMKFKYEYFIRTTDKTHEQNVSEIWQKLVDLGDIYLGKYEGWYCISDEAFTTSLNVTDSVDNNGNPCKVTIDSNKVVTWLSEENFKFRLSKYQTPILNWLKSNPGCVVPEFRRQEVIRFVEEGLIDLSISRKKSSCSWGLPIPGTDEHIMYVWLDALSNYSTGARINKDNQLVDLNSLNRWPPDVQVIGKDILKFHAVYWPAFLLAIDYPLPKTLVVHGWWTKDGSKISKSLGNVFDPVDKVNFYGNDTLRYFLLRETSFSDDGDYSDTNMIIRLNTELADTFGNLVMRCVAPKINTEGKWPQMGNDLQSSDLYVIELINELAGNVDHYYQLPNIQRALIVIFDVLREINNYTTDNVPWKLVNSDLTRLQTVLYIIMEGVRVCVSLLQPVLIDTCPRILDQLNVPQELRQGVEALKFGKMKADTPLGPAPTEPWFKKIVDLHQNRIPEPKTKQIKEI